MRVRTCSLVLAGIVFSGIFADLAGAQQGHHYVLDAYGGIHAGGGAPALNPGTPYFGFDVAVDLEFAAGFGFYVLDAFGGIHAGGGAPAMSPATSYFGVDHARDLELAPPVGSTLLFLDSELGDYVGQGMRSSYAPSDGTFRATRTFDNGVNIDFDNFAQGGSNFWHLAFSTEDDSDLVPGVYEDATRHPFNPPGSPGLSVVGDGNGCNEVWGRFVVIEATYLPGGQVVRFGADFEQHCDGLLPALFGSVRFQSTATAPGYVLDGVGAIYLGGGALQMKEPTPYFGFDLAEDLELSPPGYYVLDAFGGVIPGGGAASQTPATPYFGFDVARDMEMAASGYYVLDGYGGIHAGGGAPAFSLATPYFGFDAAVDLELAPVGFYVLDYAGGVHAGGGAPLLTPPTPYFGFDVARDLELR